jgi:hypothetical protein
MKAAMPRLLNFRCTVLSISAAAETEPETAASNALGHEWSLTSRSNGVAADVRFGPSRTFRRIRLMSASYSKAADLIAGLVPAISITNTVLYLSGCPAQGRA